jgi:hypothetical protein
MQLAIHRRMSTFIRAAEVWLPSRDHTVLELAGGVFDQVPSFSAASRDACFGRAEGLPGRAWDDGRPLLLTQLQGSYFLRAAAAAAAGLTAAMALPVFRGEQLTSLVVLLFGHPATPVGGIELWHNDPRVSTDLVLGDAYYGSAAPALEAASRDGSLSRGAGLPGQAWQRGSAVLVVDVTAVPQFLRAEVAAGVGIRSAVAWPCRSLDGHVWVVSLLSGESVPLARRIEAWTLDADGRLGRTATLGEAAAGGPAEAPYAIALASGSCTAQIDRTDEAEGSGCRHLLAIPVPQDDGLADVVALYF